MGNKHSNKTPVHTDKLCVDCLPGRNPFMRAAKAGHAECIRALVRDFREVGMLQGAIDDFLTADNKTPLIFAIQNGHHK